MSKQIKVSDETYEKLKFLADEAHRPIGRQIDYLIDYYGGEIGDPINSPPSIKNPGAAPVTLNAPRAAERDRLRGKFDNLQVRTPADILKEIDQYKLELAERLEFNQDPVSRQEIELEGKDTLDALWAEFNTLKAEGK